MDEKKTKKAMARTVKQISDKGATVSCFALSPKPLIVVATEESDIAPVMDDVDFLADTFGMLLFDIPERIRQRPNRNPCLLRCVTLERLPVILSTGCDVEPSDAVLHAAPPGHKAQEYGGYSKIMSLFDGWALEKCVRYVPKNVDANELDRMRQLYPYEDVSDDESFVLRRRPANEYLNPFYSMWIPGDPWQALLAVFVVGQKTESIIATTMDQVRECPSVHWTIDFDPTTVDPGVANLYRIVAELIAPPDSIGY